ncbi:fatty acid oxidation complex subunit alpha [Desulfoluna limicola]|uniref:Fatty acid oxidation complex subunit alpha n=1 Tax=Desulfoluna limicola TaxID=2810562 RepID=A0ABM7PEV9_9BACT|nr:3-hydroxyacyl-CoA dehydrogenase NAD-binding domain-containing protein [Desulfoluna limicola]BCS96085.1 fatty acid oxidation complex subunit alpha [Desulfoluna limicola]
MTRHITTEKLINGVWVVTLDSADSPVNALSSALFDEVESLIGEVEGDRTAKGLVIISGKGDTFVAGADLDEVSTMTTKEEVTAYIGRANAILSRLEAWPKPVVCAIHGACMGGGLELAMACNARVASDSSKTVFSLPEVKLGLLPAGGGTQRLPGLIGISEALSMMLMGKQLRPQKAMKLGLIDDITHPFALKDAAVARVLKLVGGEAARRKVKRALPQAVMEKVKPGRSLIFYLAKKGVLSQTKGVYPAPLAIIDSVKYGSEHGVERGIQQDVHRFADLVLSPESRGLTSLFHAMKGAGKGLVNGNARDVKKLAILGAGLMGNGVAGVSTDLVDSLLIKDISLDGAAKGVQEVRDGLAIRAKSGGITNFEKQMQGAKVMACDDFFFFSGTDMVIEAAFEDLTLKKKLLKEVEEATEGRTIFASNTSSLPISEIAKDAKYPELVIGMHYFSPVRSMPLLEIIATDQTADWVIETAVDFGMKQGKTCIVVQDGPAFYTTRILTIMLNEAMLLLEEGVDVSVLDDVMMRFGFPVGPVTLVDEVGFDVGVHVGAVMKPTADARAIPQSSVLGKLHGKGFLGRKNKKGFYDYGKKKRGKKAVNPDVKGIIGTKGKSRISVEEIQQRVGLTMVNEAILCLEEGVIRTPADGDLGAVLGLGFPPFTGGPFRYTDKRGPADVLKTLDGLEKKYGKRFKAATLLREKVKDGTLFHADNPL